MPIIAPTTSLASKPHRLDIWQPNGAPVPDGDGDFDQDYGDAPVGYVYGLIEAMSARRLERFGRSETVPQATHVVTMPYVDGVTTLTRLMFGTRRFDVVAYRNINDLSVELELGVQELVA